jgi:imidazolonepropionase-like amidohydrolase
MRRPLRLFVSASAVLAGAWAFAAPGAAARADLAYAIQNARIVPVSGAAIERGTVLMRNGLIDQVGASVTVPVDAIVIDGAGLTVYPGLIDMANTTAVMPPESAEPPAAGGRGAGGGGGGRGGGGGGGGQTVDDLERAKREAILRPDFDAAAHARIEGAEMQRLASAGITSVLAVPSTGTIRGRSALVNVLAPPDEPRISGTADPRVGLTVVKAPVALHVGFGGRGGGGGYPGSLLGYIAFVRQAFYDAQWQRDARAWASRHADAPRPAFEPVLDAMSPALARQMPVAFDAEEVREIERALALAKEFNLDPIIIGGAQADVVASDLKAANARVIFGLNLPGAGGGGGGGGRGGRGGGGGDTLRAVQNRVNAPRVPAALAKAQVPFAFSSAGLQNAGEFVRNAARTVKDGNLAADVALRALTIDAARIAGADARLGTLERGKIANLVVTEGDLLDNGRIRHVFIDGRPVSVDAPPPATTGRGGRGGR